MFDWAQLLGLRPRRPESKAESENDSRVRVLALTSNDHFYARLVDIATAGGWEIRRAGELPEALEILRSQTAPLVIFDWDENGQDWRLSLDRLCAAPGHPCVLLASRVLDENLRQEVMRFRGYDVLPRSADREEIVRTIQFAWFWTTRSHAPVEGRTRQEGKR